MNDKLIVCHFTQEELEYLSTVIVREDILTKYVSRSLGGLYILGVELKTFTQPNIVGKLLSYIEKAKSLNESLAEE